MLSLFCEMFCVLAQLANRTVQPAAIPLRKRRVVGFIEIMICRVNDFPEFCNPEVKKGRTKLFN